MLHVVAAGGGGVLYPGVTPDGLIPAGLAVAGRVTSQALVLAAASGLVTIPAGSGGTALTIASIAYDAPAFTAAIGQSAIVVNQPGWYAVTAQARSSENGEAGATYVLDEGGAMDFADGHPPEDRAIGSAAIQTPLEATGYLLFNNVNQTLQMELSNSGAVDATFFYYIMASYLGSA